MSGPSFDEAVWNRDSENLQKRHIQRLRYLADRLENDPGDYLADTSGDYPFLPDTERQAIVELLRAKADKLEAHMNAIDSVLSDRFTSFIRNVEYFETGDYGPGNIAESWEEYDEKR